MDKNFLMLVDLSNVQLDDTTQGASSWIHALPVGDYTHPVFGKLSMTSDKIKRFAENVKNKVRGIDPSINISHGIPGTTGDGEAVGWVKDAEARETGLWLFVDWVKSAAESIKEKKWRYFSAEFQDKWTDPTGKQHQDVLFGGALTNRPYMKNLLPINLSEASVDYAFGLVDAITTAKKEVVQDMDLKRMCELLGLPADSTEEQAFAKLAEAINGTPNPSVDQDKTRKPEVPRYTPSQELKQLAEENPMVKALIETVDEQNKVLSAFQVELRESEVNKKLSEFDNSKIILTPVAKDKIHDFLINAPVELHERFWDILGLMKNTSGLLVELGERAGTGVRYGKSKDAVSLFMDEANRLAQEKKISLDEAMGDISRENPDLWNGYRQGTYAFKE